MILTDGLSLELSFLKARIYGVMQILLLYKTFLQMYFFIFSACLFSVWVILHESVLLCSKSDSSVSFVSYIQSGKSINLFFSAH